MYVIIKIIALVKKSTHVTLKMFLVARISDAIYYTSGYPLCTSDLQFAQRFKFWHELLTLNLFLTFIYLFIYFC